MTERAVSFTEDRIPLEGIEETIEELVELYGGTVETTETRSCEVTLPLRRGVASGGSVQCTLTWADGESSEDGSVTLVCDRDIDAPKLQRVLFLLAGVAGALMFMLWPFFPGEKAYGTLAWLGGLVALAVYLMTLKKSSGGLTYDFLQRLAARQRAIAAGEVEEEGGDESGPAPESAETR
jgi:hypothetical protein